MDTLQKVWVNLLSQDKFLLKVDAHVRAKDFPLHLI
jgi:hypothetical protein